MIVPLVEYDEFISYDPLGSAGDLHGSIGPEVEREPDAKPRRPIGFRRHEPERELTPSFLLL